MKLNGYITKKKSVSLDWMEEWFSKLMVQDLGKFKQKDKEKEKWKSKELVMVMK